MDRDDEQEATGPLDAWPAVPITFDEALKELENHKGTNGTNEKINTIRDYLKKHYVAISRHHKPAVLAALSGAAATDTLVNRQWVRVNPVREDFVLERDDEGEVVVQDPGVTGLTRGDQILALRLAVRRMGRMRTMSSSTISKTRRQWTGLRMCGTA